MKFDQEIWTPEQVHNLNERQKCMNFHPYTCSKDGDEAHIAFEFKKDYPDKDYNTYIAEQKASGVPYPEMAFIETPLIATEYGWKCPVCDYSQKWAHDTDISGETLALDEKSKEFKPKNHK